MKHHRNQRVRQASITKPATHHWHKWFAWYPISFGPYLIWLRTVHRRWAEDERCWHYRKIS